MFTISFSIICNSWYSKLEFVCFLVWYNDPISTKISAKKWIEFILFLRVIRFFFQQISGTHPKWRISAKSNTNIKLSYPHYNEYIKLFIWTCVHRQIAFVVVHFFLWKFLYAFYERRFLKLRIPVTKWSSITETHFYVKGASRTKRDLLHFAQMYA